MFDYLKNKRVFITGAGTLSAGLLKELSNVECAIYNRNEASQFLFKEKYPFIKCYMGDIQDYERLTTTIRDFKPNVIIHTAAAKRVDVAELEPINTVKQNIFGSFNVGLAAIRNNVEAVIGIGTDKEVAPQTIYGYTKALGSSILLDFDRQGDTKFSIVRYGNILCSRSSVGVIWLNAAKEGKKIKVTNGDMTRFWFTIDQAVELIDFGLWTTISSPHGHGKIYSTQMCASKLIDLASALDEQYHCGIETIGLRVSAEKMHECLISEKEVKDTVRCIDINRKSPIYANDLTLQYFITAPGSNKSDITAPFTSENAPQLNKYQLLDMIKYADDITYKG